MGNGASVLSEEQKAALSKDMQEKYENLTAEEKSLSQEELLTRYEQLTASQTESSTPHYSLPIGKKKNKKRLTRSRSYDNEEVPSPLKSSESTPTISVASPPTTDATTSKENAQEDHWESVRAQPTCLICKMIFATETKLTTHIKYSEVHAKNVQAAELKLKPLDSQDQQPAAVVSLPELPSFRCRELYSGAKFYWRTQDSIEYHIYLHIEEKCVEVIPYDNQKSLEYPRLYFDENKIYTIVGEGVIATNVRNRMNEMGKANQVVPSKEILLEDERRQAIAHFLMSKLQLSVDNLQNKSIEFQINASEGGEFSSPLLSQKSETVTPVLIHRRRLSTSEEIDGVLQETSELELKIKLKLREAEDFQAIVSSPIKL